MFLRFSEEAQKLFLLSLKEKNKLNDSLIGTEHIFLAVLLMKNNYICKLLNNYNIFYDEFLSYFSKKDVNNNINYFVFTPLMKDVLNNISNGKKNDITVSDIIVEILGNGNSKVNLILRKMGINIKDILKNINMNNKKKKNITKGLLNDIGINLNEKCLNDDDIILGRDKEINMIIEVLCCKNKNNPILIGDAGVGKTAIVEELARRIASGNIPIKLKNKKIYSVSMSSLVAGTKYRGEFEEKINKLISEVESNDDIILFIDEIHTLVGAGGADGAIDASNILKPSLARGNIKIIGATTNDEYQKYFADDKALSRRFKTIIIEEPDTIKTKEILLGIKKIYEEFHNVIIPDIIIDKIIYFADKYIKNRKFPDKAIDVLDEVCVLSSFTLNSSYLSINNLDKEINDIISLKNKSLIVGDYKAAIKYSYDEKVLQSKIGKVQSKIYKNNKKNIVNEKTLFQIMERKTNIPFYSYKYEFNKFLKKLKKYKQVSIFDSDIIDRINGFTLDFYSNLINNSFNNCLYISSDNYNKNNYFINEYIKIFFNHLNLINIDINNFRNIDDLLRDNDKDNFLNKIKNNPFSVIIVNNFDNSDISIKEFFENINKIGYYLDKNNDKIDFSNVLFIYSFLDKNNMIGFNNLKTETNNNFNININSISKRKLGRKIILLYKEMNCSYTKANINEIANSIINDFNKLSNLDYFIRKEILNNSNNLKKNRTIKV